MSIVRNHKTYLRRLRKLDREWQLARRRLANVRALADSLPADRPDLLAETDLSSLEEEEATARAAYDEHAAREPELSREYADRAELAEVNADARRRERELHLLLTAPAPATLASRTAASEAHVEAYRARLAEATRAASELDAEYQAQAAAGANWHTLGLLEKQAGKLRLRVGAAETGLANAERRHREAIEREQAAVIAARRRAADIEIARAELDRTRAYAAELRERIPATTRAPLREARGRGYGAPATPEQAEAIRERYTYEPATGTLHRLPRGELVRATQTVMVAGERVPRAAVIAVLAPPAAFNPEELA